MFSPTQVSTRPGMRPWSARIAAMTCCIFSGVMPGFQRKAKVWITMGRFYGIPCRLLCEDLRGMRDFCREGSVIIGEDCPTECAHENQIWTDAVAAIRTGCQCGCTRPIRRESEPGGESQVTPREEVAQCGRRDRERKRRYRKRRGQGREQPGGRRGQGRGEPCY